MTPLLAMHQNPRPKSKQLELKHKIVDLQYKITLIGISISKIFSE